MYCNLKTHRDVLKRVAKRKKAILCKTLKVTVEQVRELAENGIINPGVVSSIKTLNENNYMASIIESLLLETPEQCTKFLDFVKEQSPWMYEEMLTESRAETKELEVDDYEMDDASVLIHRHFGASRRFSEVDKKTMTSLVATKSQVAKEVWSRRLSVSKSELEDTRKVVAERDELVKKTNELIKTFIRRNERELYDFKRSKSTTQILAGNAEDNNVLGELITRTDFLIKKFEAILLDKQAMNDQRQQCMAILNVEDSTIPLHKLVKQTINKLSRENESGRIQVKSLKMKTIELEEELNEKDVQLDKLKVELESFKRKGKVALKSPPQVASRSLRDSSQGSSTSLCSTPTSPNCPSRQGNIFPSLDQKRKPKYCSRPRENNKTMPLHGRSFLLDVA